MLLVDEIILIPALLTYWAGVRVRLAVTLALLPYGVRVRLKLTLALLLYCTCCFVYAWCLVTRGTWRHTLQGHVTPCVCVCV